MLYTTLENFLSSTCLVTKRIAEKKIGVDELAPWKMIHDKITIHDATSYTLFFS